MKIFAHRGASGYHKDNSEKSIIAAFDMYADYIEVDIQLCKSGELVLNHDLWLESESGSESKNNHTKQHMIADLTLSELRQIDNDIIDHSQLMQLVLDTSINKGHSGLYLDLKTHFSSEDKFLEPLVTYLELFVPLYTNIVNQSGNKPFMVASFNHELIGRLIQRCSSLVGIQFGIIAYAAPLLDYIDILHSRYGISFFVMDHLNIRLDLVYKLNNSGIKVLLYTINDHDELTLIQQMADNSQAQIDGIVTNYPNKFIMIKNE